MKKQFLIAMISIIFSTSSIAMFQEQEEDPIDALFVGRYTSSLKDLYFKSLEDDDDTYNPIVSEAALFLARQLETEKDLENARLAYAYAYYYNPENENIPIEFLRIVLPLSNLSKNKKIEFIAQIMSNKTVNR